MDSLSTNNVDPIYYDTNQNMRLKTFTNTLVLVNNMKIQISLLTNHLSSGDSISEIRICHKLISMRLQDGQGHQRWLIVLVFGDLKVFNQQVLNKVYLEIAGFLHQLLHLLNIQIESSKFSQT